MHTIIGVNSGQKNVKVYMQSVGISDNYFRQYILDVAEKNNVKEKNIAELVQNLPFPSS